MKRTVLALRNTLSQTFARLYSSALGFATALIIISRLGSSLYGDLSKVTALLVIGYTALDFGLNAHTVRILSSLSVSAKKVTLSNLIYFRLILSFIISLALIITLLVLSRQNPSGYGHVIQLSLLIGLISIFSQSLHISGNALFQHQERYDKMTRTVILGSTVGFLATILAIYYFPGVVGLTLALTLGYLTTGATSLVFVREYLTASFSWPVMKSIIKGSLALALVLILSTIANRSDVLIQAIFQPSSAVGEYAFAYKIFDFALIIPVFLMNSLYPSILKNISNPTKTRADLRKVIRALLLVSLLALALLYLAAPLILIIKPDLTLTPAILRLLALSLPLFYFSAPLMWIFVATGQETSLIPIYLLATLGNVAGNYFLSSSLGITSAAYLTIATELFITLALFIISRKHKYV